MGEGGIGSGEVDFFCALIGLTFINKLHAVNKLELLNLGVPVVDFP